MRIALLVSYHGPAFSGNTYHDGSTSTVEQALLDGLKKTGYLRPEATFKDAELERAGRTDSGVSARCMLYTVRIHKSVPVVQSHTYINSSTISGLNGFPIDPQCIHVVDKGPQACVCFNLNRVLPAGLRVLGAAPDVPEAFSARHSCVAREYEYILGYNVPPDDILKADMAAKSFLGSHNFHNFCRDEKDTETVYTRQVYISEVFERDSTCIFRVVGSAFLYHQVRYMSSLIIHILTGLEKPSVIKTLLDKDASKGKRTFPLVQAQYLSFKCGWYSSALSCISFCCSAKAYSELVLHVLAHSIFHKSILGHSFAAVAAQPVLQMLNINKRVQYRSLEEESNGPADTAADCRVKAQKR